MQLINDIVENRMLESLTSLFPRSALQYNRLHESDAELLRLPGTDLILALKTYSIVEEIESGLYSDPYLIGWMTVTVNASDLAAVGAEPLGIMLSETLPFEMTDEFRMNVQRGIRDACGEYGFHVLGGDTNFSKSMQMGATGIGIVSNGRVMTRLGAQPGDLVFASGPLGLGSAYALAQFGNPESVIGNDLEFKPMARLKEGRVLRPFASCCMDTSDGAIATLDQLMRLNDVGIELDARLEEILHPLALKSGLLTGLPLWTFLAGPHGEFELIFAVRASDVEKFMVATNGSGWRPIPIGKVTAEPGMRILNKGNMVCLPTCKIRNLFTEVGGDVKKYINGLCNIDGGLQRQDG